MIDFSMFDPLFLRKVIKIEEARLKGQLFIYKDLDKDKIEQFWSEITRIHLTRFNKTMIFTPRGYKGKFNLRGTFKIRYHSKEAFQKLDRIIRKVLK